MSSDRPSCSTAVTDDSANVGVNDSSTAAAASDALAAWASLVDELLDQHADGLSNDVRRTLTASLSQSKAVLALAESLARVTRDAPENAGLAHASADPLSGLWQPILDAVRACEASVLAASPDPVQNERYAAAAGAYFGEFARLNVDLSRRLQEKLGHLGPDTGFVGIHRLILEEAEKAYLEHVSSDRFARRQADFINALLLIARPSTEGNGPGAKEAQNA